MWKEGDFVVTTKQTEGRLDGTGLVFKIEPGFIGRIVKIDEGIAFDDILVSFEGNLYWFLDGPFKKVEVLDEMGKMGD